MMHWDNELPTAGDTLVATEYESATSGVQVRLDALLPAHPETGAVTALAFKVYLDTMIDMVVRAGQPLSLIALAVDDTPPVRFFGAEGAGLIGRAIVRCVRQETRPHDVVGVTGGGEERFGIPVFVIACPLMPESNAAQLAERLCAAMIAGSGEDTAWLTVSIGVASLSIDVAEADGLLMRANSAVQRAQRMGGSRVWRHTDTLRRIIEQSDEATED